MTPDHDGGAREGVAATPAALEVIRWGRPRLTLEVSSGAAEGFSLQGLEGVHVVTRTQP